MSMLQIILMVVAFVFFLLAAWPAPADRPGRMWAIAVGLACWSLSIFIPFVFPGLAK